MNILLFIALLLAPYLSDSDTIICAGYAKELTFCVLSLICISITFIRNREWDIRIYDIVALFLLIFIVVNPRFWDNEAYIAIALVLIWWSVSRLHWSKMMLYGLITVGVIHAVASLSQIVLFPPLPLKGVMGNSGIMGIYIALVVPLALGLAFAEKQWWIKMLMSGIVLLLLATLLITQSRTALLAVIAGCGYLIWRGVPLKSICPQWMQGRRAKWIGGAVFGMMIVAGAVALLQYRMGSVNGRVLIYRATASMIADQPLRGHGYNTFAAQYPDYQARFFVRHPDSPLATFADNSEVAFNEYLHVAAEYGLIGLLIGLGLLVSLFRIPNSTDRLVLLCKASLIAFLVAACFSYPLRRYETLMVVLIVTGILASKDIRKICTIPRWGLLVSIPLFICFYISFGKIIYKQAVGYPIWQKAQTGKLSMDERLQLYEVANTYLGHNVAFVYNYAVTLSRYEKAEGGNALFRRIIPYMNTSNIQVMIGINYEHLSKSDSAERYYLHAHTMVPNRFYPLYKLMICYRNQMDTAKMHDIAHQILFKSVKIPSYTVERIKMEANEMLK